MNLILIVLAVISVFNQDDTMMPYPLKMVQQGWV